jgi:hypothetical protein
MCHPRLLSLIVALGLVVASSGLNLKRRVGKNSPDEYIRYGFTQDQTMPLLTRHTVQLFNISPDKRSVPTGRGYTITSDSASETAKEIQGKVGLEGNYGAFSASAEASTNSISNSAVKKFRSDRMIIVKDSAVSLSTSYAHRMLIPEIKELLLSESPEKIVKTIGSFYARQLTLGCMLQVTNLVEMTSHDTKESMTTKVEAKYGLGASISGSVEGAVKTTSFGKNSMSHSKWQALGGNTRIWLGLQNDGSNYEAIKSEWVESLSDDNMYIVGMKLAPIWELLDHREMNVNKARQLENYLKKKWRTEAAGIQHWQPLPECGRKGKAGQGRWLAKYSGLTTCQCESQCNAHATCGSWQWYPNNQGGTECHLKSDLRLGDSNSQNVGGVKTAHVSCEHTRHTGCTAHPLDFYQPKCEKVYDGYKTIDFKYCGQPFSAKRVCRKQFTCPPGSVCNGGGCKIR